MSDSIFGDRVRMITSAPWSPPRTCAATVHTSTTIASAHDARLIAILDMDSGEPTYVAFARKECELGEAFAKLPILDQRALHTRLGTVRSGDVLAEKFNRLTADRRARLLIFLGDARRRAARAAATTKRI
jgi:hypothetical protein